MDEQQPSKPKLTPEQEANLQRHLRRQDRMRSTEGSSAAMATKSVAKGPDMSWFKYFVEVARIAKAEAATNRTLRSILKVILIFGCLLVAGISVGLAMFAAFLAIFSGGVLSPLVAPPLAMIAVSLGLAWAIFAIRNMDIIVVVALLSLLGISLVDKSGMLQTVEWPSFRKDGHYVAHYRGGQKKSERFFDNGRETGIWSTWYESGARKSAQDWHCNKRGPTSRINEWHENGQLKSSGNYVRYRDDRTKFKSFLWTTWDENGQLLSAKWFNRGELVPDSVWRPNYDPEKFPVDIPC